MLRYGGAGRGLCFFGGVGCEGEGPEPVVVGSGWVVEGYAACLGEGVSLGVELVEEGAIVGDAEVSGLVSGEEESCLFFQLGDYRLELDVVGGQVLQLCFPGGFYS